MKLLIIASPTTRNAGAYQFWEHLRTELRNQNVSVILLRGHEHDDLIPNSPLKLRPASTLSFLRRVQEIIKTECVTHVVTSISQSDIVFGLSLRHWLRLPWIVYVLGQPFPVLGQGNAIKRTLWKILWHRAALNAAKVLTVSDYLTRMIKSGLPEKEVLTAYPGLPQAEKDLLRRSRSVPSTGQLRVGFIGRLSPEKDPTTFCSVGAASPELEFHVFGDGELRQELESRFESVKFHGFADRYEAFKRIDVMLITSVSEGLPTILLEAAEAGVVPIVADVGGCVEAIHPLVRQRLVVPKATRQKTSAWLTRLRELENADVRSECIALQSEWIRSRFQLRETAFMVVNGFASLGAPDVKSI